MSTIDQALLIWRRKRRNVSAHRQTNIEAWLVELETVLADHGLSQEEASAHIQDSLRSFVEKEYAQVERPAG